MAPADLFVRADKQTISFPGTGTAKDTIHITSNTSWSVVLEQGATFIQAEPLSGSGDADIIFTSVASNNSTSIKSTNVEVKPSSGQNSAVITILQFAAIQSVLRTNFGGEGLDVFNDFAATADGGYIAVGSTTSTQGDADNAKGGLDLWIVKFDNEGNKQWHKLYGGEGNDFATSIVRTAQNTFLVLGATNSTGGDVSSHKGETDAWLLNIDADGDLLWEKTLGGSHAENLFNLKLAGNGNYLMCGWTNSTDHDVAANDGGTDAWLVKVDGDGGIVWEKTFGGTNTEVAYDVTPVSDGGTIFCGHVVSNDGDVSDRISEGHAAWIVKLNAAGNIAGKVYAGSSEFDNATVALETSSGDYIFAGETNTPGEFDGFHANRDAFVSRVSGSGNFIWKKAYGGSMRDQLSDLIEVADGNFVFAGTTMSNDGDISNPLGGEDAWFVKINGNGNILSNFNLGSTVNDHIFQVKQLNTGPFAFAGQSKDDAWFEIISF